MIMNYLELIFPFLGGLGMFIYGMQIMAQGLENAAGSKMKTLLRTLTKNKLMGVLLGFVITAVIQSSSATTVMVVGFVNAGIMNLIQAMSIIMGANIGTTVTGWVVASGEWAKFLSPSTLAPIAIIIGVVMMLTARKSKVKEIAVIIIGFGLLFMGIEFMSTAVTPLRDEPVFMNLFISLGKNPFLGILAGAAITALLQSSSASVGILQSLAAAGLVPFGAAIYIIMGQNIGTCITAMLSSIGAKKTAKTAAFMHLLFNVIGTAIFSVFVIIFFNFVNKTIAATNITQTQISLVHTIFNITTTVLLFPASGLIVKLAGMIVGKEPVKTKTEVGMVHLDERMLETPAFALQSTVNETARMGQIVNKAMRVTQNVLFTKSEDDIDFIKKEEDRVDKLSAGITAYAIKLSSLPITEREHQKLAELLQVVNDMERISDYTENIAEYAEELINKDLTISKTATEELTEMLSLCCDCYDCALKAYAENDRQMALRVVELETKTDELEIRLRKSHIDRLRHNTCDPETGIVFLDTIVGLERITDHSRNIAEEILKEYE